MKRNLLALAAFLPSLALASSRQTSVSPTISAPVQVNLTANTPLLPGSALGAANLSANVPLGADKAAPIQTAAAQVQNAALTAQTPQGQAPSPEARIITASQVFDGAAAPKRSEVAANGMIVAGGVALSAFVPGVPAAPFAVEAARLRSAGPNVEEKRPWSKRLPEYLEAALMSVPIVIASALEVAWLGKGPLLGMALAATWAIGGLALVETIGGLRSKVVGGWQASHDQKYRVGPDGRMRDVRGHKYGEDRYDEKVNGEVTAREQGTIRVLSALAGSTVLLLAGASPETFVAFNLTLAALHGLGWYKDARTPRPAAIEARPHDR